MNKVTGIYKIINLSNGKIYIGSSINVLKRWRYHITDLNAHRHHNSYLQKSWDKYGKDNFEFNIIEEVENADELIEREQYWMDQLQPYGERGYNLCSTTTSYSSGYFLQQSTKEKLRNRSLSESHKQKMSNSSSRKRKIVQLNLEGQLISIWDSLTAASKSLNIKVRGISGSILKKSLTYKNSIWFYYEDYISDTFKEIIEPIIQRIQNKKSKPKRITIQMDMEYNFIKKWDSIVEASRQLGVCASSIKDCCRGKRSSTKGFRWAYEEDYDKNILSKFIPKPRSHKAVIQLDMKYDIVRRWESINQIQKELNYKSSIIGCCCSKKQKSGYGFLWVYEDEFK